MFWGILTLGILALLLIVKILTVLELRSQDIACRTNTKRIQELGDELDNARRKYMIALKAEGLLKYKMSQLRTRYADLKQHYEQIQATTAQHEQRRQKEMEVAMEKAVMEVLGGPSARRDSHFKRVMKTIRQLIDLDKQNNSEELIATVQEKLAELGGRAGLENLGTAQRPADGAAEA